MGERKIRDVTDQVVQDEADALALLLANEERSVMVHVTIAYNDQHGIIRHGHGVAGKTTGAHLRQFIAATTLQLKWLNDKLHRRT